MVDQRLERRTRRSDNAYQASQLYLESCRERYRCEAMALATDDGLLIAGVGDNAETVGAIASAPTSLAAVIWTRAFASRLQAFTITVGQDSVHVGVLGRVPKTECTETLGRILRPLLATA